MNRVSPSFHSLDCRSNCRGVEATVKFATAAPEGVKRSSGSPVMLPMTVMTVSPAMKRVPCSFGSGGGAGGADQDQIRCSSGAGAQELGAHDRLVQAELAVQLLGRGRLSGEVDDGVDALGLLLDVVGQATTAPDVDVVDGALVLGHDGEELVERRSDRAVVQLGVEDDHQFVLTHAGNPPPLVCGGHGPSVTGGLQCDPPPARAVGGT